MNIIKSFLTKPRLLLFLVILLGFGLRFFHLADLPVSLYWDEAAHLLELKIISQTGLDQFSQSVFQTSFIGWGDFKLPAYTWFSLPLAYLHLPDHLWVRALSAISGVVSIVGMYYLARLLSFGKRSSLLTAFAISLSPWLIQFSRAGYEANFGLMWLILSAVFYTLFIKSNTNVRHLLSLVLFTLSTIIGLYSYYSFRWAIVGLIIFLTLIASGKIVTSRKIISVALIFLAIFLLGVLPQYLGDKNAYANQFRLSADNVFTNSDLITKSASLIEADGNTWLSRKTHHRFLFYGHDLAVNTLSYLDGNYLLVSGDSNLRHSTGKVGILYWWQLAGLLVGVVATSAKRLKLGLGLILLWLWLIIPGALTYESPHAMRSLNAAIPLMLLTGYGWGHIFSRLKKSWLIVLVLFLVLFATVEFRYYLHDYYNHYRARSAHAWQDGYSQAFQVLNLTSDVTTENIFISDKYFLPHLYFLLYTDYPLSAFQTERTSEFASTNSYPFDQKLGNNIQFVSQGQLNFSTPGATYVSAQKLDPYPSNYQEIPINDSARQPTFYIYSPLK